MAPAVSGNLFITPPAQTLTGDPFVGLQLTSATSIQPERPSTSCASLPVNGFFTAPRNLPNGLIIKPYQGLLGEKEAARLANMHDSFVAALQGIGIRIPKTDLRFDRKGGKIVAYITQERFEFRELARPIVGEAAPELAIATGLKICDDALKFIGSGLLGKHGFHPTIRNYAIRNGEAWMIDTFPPYGTEQETREMMRRHAPTRRARFLMRAAGSFLLSFYTKEYYDPVEMVAGIAGSMSRMRPELTKEFNEQVLERAYESRFPSMHALRERLRHINENVAEKPLRFCILDGLRPAQAA